MSRPPRSLDPAELHAFVSSLQELLEDVSFSDLPWFLGPLTPEDDYGDPTSVEIGPYELELGRDSFHESAIAYVLDGNHVANSNAELLVRAVNALPTLVNELLKRLEAERLSGSITEIREAAQRILDLTQSID